MRSNAEDVRRDEEELTSSSHHVMTLDGDIMALNGKLLSTGSARGGGGGGGCRGAPQQDQVSVCSCTCLPHRPSARVCSQHAVHSGIPLHRVVHGAASAAIAADSQSGLASFRGEYSPLVGGDPLFRRGHQRKRSM